MVVGLLGAVGRGALLRRGVRIPGARGSPDRSSPRALDPRLMLRLVRSWRYLLGVGLDGLAFLFSLAALRTPAAVRRAVDRRQFLGGDGRARGDLPAAEAPSPDKIGVAVVVAGLIMVGMSSAEESAGRRRVRRRTGGCWSPRSCWPRWPFRWPG